MLAEYFFLRFTIKGPARDHRYYECLRVEASRSRATPPSGWPVASLSRGFRVARLCHDRNGLPFEEVVPPVEFALVMADLPAYPSVTFRHVAHADPAGPLSEATTVNPGSDSSAFTKT